MGDKLDQAQKNGVVIGLGAVTGQVVARLDIDQLLLSEPDAFNLFILALIELQDKKFTSDKMGYYQMAGIHGLPTQLWDGVDSDNKDPNRPWQGEGYCTHGLPTFPTWHRPYLAMYEQSIYHKMREIVERYPEAVKPKYRAALKRFRLPYWDYYRPRAEKKTVFQGITMANGMTSFDYDFSIPQVFTVAEVMVRRTSDDKLVRSRNPLNRYPFPTEQEGGFKRNDVINAAKGSVTTGAFTVRYPKNSDDVVGDVQSLNAGLNQVRESGTLNILDMITTYNDYESYASTSSTTGSSGSLEGIHNNYHVKIGGRGKARGWMSSVPTAAFDPVFWIHHCLIDRWAAIWQAAHPDKWFTDSQEDAAQGAMPFRAPAGQSGQYWNHNESRYTKIYGYDYEEARGTSAEVIARFKRRHEWSTRENGAREFQEPPPEMAPLDLSKAQVYQYTQADPVPGGVGPVVGDAPQRVFSAMTSAAASVTQALKPAHTIEMASMDDSTVSTDPVKPGTSGDGVAFTNMPAGFKDAAPAGIDESKYVRSWYIDNMVERLAYNGPFTVYYFIGPFDDNADDWGSEPTNAGFNFVFTSSRELCDNCGVQGDTHALVTNTSVITPILLDYVKIGQLEDLTPEKVVPFLIANLKWRVSTLEGVRKDPRTTPGFKIGVSSKLVPIDAAGGHPLYQEYPQIIDEIVNRAS